MVLASTHLASEINCKMKGEKRRIAHCKEDISCFGGCLSVLEVPNGKDGYLHCRDGDKFETKWDGSSITYPGLQNL